MTVMADLEKTEDRKTCYSRRNLYLAALSVYSLFASVGMILSWASPSIPKLKEDHNFSNSQYALLSSITGLAPGPLITMFGIDTIGRKWTLFIIWASSVTGYIIMLISTNIYALLVARFISGWGMGAAFSAVGIYIAEIADVGVRGPLNSGAIFFMGIGSIISYSVGPFVAFNTFTIVSLAVCSIFGLLWFFLPESPFYHIRKDQMDKALSTVKYLRLNASPNDVEKEVNDIKFSIEEEKKVKTGIRKLLTSKAVFKQFAVSFYLLYLQQGAGLNPMASYAQEIFEEAKLDFRGAYVPIGLMIISTLAIIPGPFILKRFGIKILFFIGGFGSGIWATLLGLHFTFLEAGYDLSAIKYAPIILNLLLTLTTHLGLGGNVWGTVSELFAPSVKGLATGICGIFSTLLGFVALEVFGELKNSLRIGKTLLGFGVLQCIASIGLFFIIDTSKMTLQEIQDYFEGKTKYIKKK